MSNKKMISKINSLFKIKNYNKIFREKWGLIWIENSF